MTEYERNLIQNQIDALKQKIKSYEQSLGEPVAWAKINDRGDLYDLRLQNNPYGDQNKVVPLFRIKND
jgi:hypothetical protein